MISDRMILHSDMNCFYASVEMMLNPKLRNKPIVVCGNTDDRHGIVLAKSELAKKSGIKTGMVNWEAKQRCPEVIFVPPQYDQYLKYSKLAHEIYYRYTNIVEPFGMDECWLDVTGNYRCNSPMQIAQQIRLVIKEELGLTVSIGVSFNKIFAKLGSDMKKPDAITEITKNNFRNKVWPLPASDLLGVGPATNKKLNNIGIHTIGDIATFSVNALEKIFGVKGKEIWLYANGEDTSRVMHKDFVSPIKSIGHGITCTTDLNTPEEVWKVMLELSQDIGHKLRIHNLSASGVQVAIRTHDLNVMQFQGKLPFKTQLPNEIAKNAFEIYKHKFKDFSDCSVRSVTVRAIDLNPKNEAIQLSMFSDNEKISIREHLEDTVEDIRKRFGKNAITYATILGNLKMPVDGRYEIIMPSAMLK